MKTFRITFALAAALLISIPMVAEDKPKEKRGAGRLSPTAQTMMRLSRLREALDGLDLTSEQKEKLDTIREELGPRMKEVYGKLQDVLTEEQRSAAQESMTKSKDSGLKGREFFAAVEAAIKLTDEQKQKMAKVNEELLPLEKEMMQKIMGVLTKEQQEKIKEKMSSGQKKKGEAGKK